MANQNSWEKIQPDVDASAEFLEIVNDFGDPLELLREAISNAIDWEATLIRIRFEVETIDGIEKLVIYLEDDGLGMTKEVLSTSFWGLGYSESRKLKKDEKRNIIGEKGHGTKIYLRSERVEVITKSKEGIFESFCSQPFSDLYNQEIHKPELREIPDPQPDSPLGTEVRIVGYNHNERSKFRQAIVKDYIVWFTKAGSIEGVFDIEENKDFRVFLKCLDTDDFEEIKFGHPFPEENSDIEELFKKDQDSAVDNYVKRFIYKDERLKNHPEVTFDLVVSIEGDQAKREYNPMIRERTRKETGRYKVSDRYGIWICKDYIPIMRINDWVSGFGTGSNSLPTLIHGFINCQKLKLTANRGAISNTDPKIQEDLKERVQDIFNEVDTYLQNEGIYILKDWQEEHKTLKQEEAEYGKRTKSIKTRKRCEFEGRVFLEPRNEAELFGLFMSVYSLHPEKFLFEPLDYNTTRGIDLIARNKTPNTVSENEFWYVELKFRLKKDFNHAFKHLRWILCWDFDKNLSENSKLTGVEENDIRYLKKQKDENGKPLYFIDKQSRGGNRIEVIKLKEFLKIELNIEFR